MSPRTHPNDEPARSDKAILAAEDAVWAVARERAGAGGFEALGPVEVTRIAVEAARPVIVAEMAKKIVSLAYGQPPDWCVENIEDDMTVPAGDVRAVAEGRYYFEDGYYVRLPAAVRTETGQ